MVNPMPESAPAMSFGWVSAESDDVTADVTVTDECRSDAGSIESELL